MVLASIEPGELNVEPGGMATAQIRVRNQSTRVDEFQLSVLGDMAQWATVTPASISLFPKTEGTATVTFRPPRASAPAAGTYPFGILARSKADKDDSVAEEGHVTVGPFVALAAEARPRTSRGTRIGEHAIGVRNDGNAPATIAAKAVDPDDALSSLTVEPGRAEVAAGSEIALRATARAGGTRVFGATRRFPFSIEVTEPSSSAQSVQAVFEQRALLPAWILAALGFLVALVVFVLASGILNPPQETPGPGQPTEQPTARPVATPPPEVTDAPGDTPTPEPTTATFGAAHVFASGPGFDVEESNNGAGAVLSEGRLVIYIPVNVNGAECVGRVVAPAFVGVGSYEIGDPASGAEYYADFSCGGAAYEGGTGELRLDERQPTLRGHAGFSGFYNFDSISFDAEFSDVPIATP